MDCRKAWPAQARRPRALPRALHRRRLPRPASRGGRGGRRRDPAIHGCQRPWPRSRRGWSVRLRRVEAPNFSAYLSNSVGSLMGSPLWPWSTTWVQSPSAMTQQRRRPTAPAGSRRPERLATSLWSAAPQRSAISQHPWEVVDVGVAVADEEYAQGILAVLPELPVPPELAVDAAAMPVLDPDAPIVVLPVDVRDDPLVTELVVWRVDVADEAEVVEVIEAEAPVLELEGLVTFLEHPASPPTAQTRIPR